LSPIGPNGRPRAQRRPGRSRLPRGVAQFAAAGDRGWWTRGINATRAYLTVPFTHCESLKLFHARRAGGLHVALHFPNREGFDELPAASRAGAAARDFPRRPAAACLATRAPADAALAGLPAPCVSVVHHHDRPRSPRTVLEGRQARAGSHRDPGDRFYRRPRRVNRREGAIVPVSVAAAPVAPPLIPEELIDLKTVMRRTGLAKSTISKLIAAGTFPPRVKVTDRSTRWSARAVEAWIQGRITASTDRRR
jgi:prophage regulatory protein